MKEINIYETKTELGQQSVVLVVDMTLSLGSKVDASKDETDVLATGGYQNTRWYQLKTALNNFVESYLGDNIGEKRSIAIVGFCDGVVLNTGFMTDSDAVKAQYANIFTEKQYDAAIDFAEYCSKQKDPEKAFRKIFEDNNKEDSYKNKFKDNGDGTYVIDVDLLQILDKTSRYIGYDVTKPGLQSGTNIASGLKVASTDDFSAQDAILNLALKLGVPFMAPQMYADGLASEITFYYPGVTKTCPKCILHNRYEEYAKGYKNTVTSEGTIYPSILQTNALEVQIILMLLLHHKGNNRYTNMLDEVAEFPILVLILVRKLRPMIIGSHSTWLMLAGMTARPAAISLRTNSGVIWVLMPADSAFWFSRMATYSISSVMMPCLA